MSFEEKKKEYKEIYSKIEVESGLREKLTASFKSWLSTFNTSQYSILPNIISLKTIIDIYFILYDFEAIKSTISSEIFDIILDQDIYTKDNETLFEIIKSIDDSVSIMGNIYSNSPLLKQIYEKNWYPFAFNEIHKSNSLDLHKAFLENVMKYNGSVNNTDKLVNGIIKPIFQGVINSWMDEKQIIKYVLTRAGGDIPKSRKQKLKPKMGNNKTPDNWLNKNRFDNKYDINRFHMNTNVVVENCDTKLHVLPELGKIEKTKVEKLQRYNEPKIRLDETIEKINDIRELIAKGPDAFGCTGLSDSVKKYLENILRIQEKLSLKSEASDKYYRISIYPWVSQPEKPKNSSKKIFQKARGGHKTDIEDFIEADNISLYKSVSLNFRKSIEDCDKGVLDFDNHCEILAMVYSRRLMNSLISLHDSYDKISLNTMGLFSPYNGSTLRAWTSGQAVNLSDRTKTLKAEWIDISDKEKQNRYLKWKYLSSHFRKLVRISHKLNKDICKGRELEINGDSSRRTQRIKTKKGGGRRPSARKNQYHEKKVNSGYWKRAFRKIGWGFINIPTLGVPYFTGNTINYNSRDKNAVKNPKKEREIQISDIEYMINIPDFQSILSPSYPTISPLVCSEGEWRYGVLKKNQTLFTNFIKGETDLKSVILNDNLYKHSSSEASLKNRYVISDNPTILKYPPWFDPEFTMVNGYKPSNKNWNYSNLDNNNFSLWIVTQWVSSFPRQIENYFTTDYKKKLSDANRYNNYIKNLARLIMATYGLMNEKNNSNLLDYWFALSGNFTGLGNLMKNREGSKICGSGYKD